MTERENEVKLAEMKVKVEALKEATEKADSVLDGKIDGISKKLWAVVATIGGVVLKLVSDYIGTRGP